MISKDLINDVQFALNINNKTNISETPITSNVNSIEEYLAIQKANSEFASLDKGKGDNFVFIPQLIGGVIGGSLNLYAQYTRNKDTLTLDNINWTELGLNTAIGAWSGGASTIGGAIIRGGVSSGTNGSYNQFIYESNNSLKDKSIIVLKKTIYGGVTALGVSEIGIMGNTIIKQTGVVGKQTNLPLNTYKIEAESVGGITGAIAPGLLYDTEDKK